MGEQHAEQDQEGAVHDVGVLLERDEAHRPELQHQRAEQGAVDARQPAEHGGSKHGDALRKVERAGALRRDEVIEVGEEGTREPGRDGPERVSGQLHAVGGDAERRREHGALAQHQERRPVARGQQVAQDREPSDGDDGDGEVVAVAAQLMAEEGQRRDVEEPDLAAGPAAEDRDEVRHQQHQEERRHGKRPAAEPKSWNARDEADHEGRSGGCRQVGEKVGGAVGCDVARDVRTHGVERDLAEGELSGVPERQVQAADDHREHQHQAELAYPIRPEAEPRHQ